VEDALHLIKLSVSDLILRICIFRKIGTKMKMYLRDLSIFDTTVPKERLSLFLRLCLRELRIGKISDPVGIYTILLYHIFSDTSGTSPIGSVWKVWNMTYIICFWHIILGVDVMNYPIGHSFGRADHKLHNMQLPAKL
jgi:AraC-like DNA-binding protein